MDENKMLYAMSAQTITDHEKKERHYQIMGMVVILIGVITFFFWAAFAPLDKGVTAPGTVIVAGHRKVVQAPGYGIVENIRVKEGDSIQINAPLIELSHTSTQARYEQAQDKYLAALAAAARLQAERDRLDTPIYPDILHEAEWQAQGEAAIALQNQLFYSRRQAIQSEINSSQHQLAGLQYQIKGIRRTLELKQKMNANLLLQLRDIKELAQQNILPLNRYRELERQQHDTQSQIEELIGQIASSQEKQKEIEQRIRQREGEYDREVNTQLEKAIAERNEQQKNMQITRYELDNTTITAPLSGTVMALSVLTPGSVLSAGEKLMEIVPNDAPQIIEAQVSADLIDKISPGLQVNMMFTALNQNKTPVIPGHVTLVSPDRLVNPNSGEPYYQIQIAINDEGMALLKNEDIRPGMPVGVLIKTGSRSLLNYLFKPVLDRARTALTEE